MNTTKVMLKAIVLTQLMEAIAESGEVPTKTMLLAVVDLNASLDALKASGDLTMDQPITKVWEQLLAAVETLGEAL